MPTQCYTSAKVGKIFFETLLVDLDSVQTQKWKYDKVTIFQSVILQCAQDINNDKHIRMCIQFQLDFWNCGSCDKLMKDTFNVDTGFMRKTRMIQHREQHNHTFLNLDLT